MDSRFAFVLLCVAICSVNAWPSPLQKREECGEKCQKGLEKCAEFGVGVDDCKEILEFCEDGDLKKTSSYSFPTMKPLQKIEFKPYRGKRDLFSKRGYCGYTCRKGLAKCEEFGVSEDDCKDILDTCKYEFKKITFKPIEFKPYNG